MKTEGNIEIKRDSRIQFHPKGTLQSVTRWINTHESGIAEWMKNVRRAYQFDRANIEPNERVAVILFKDAEKDDPARIGVLDVGGATLDDVERWSVWQDPTASSRATQIQEEITQGNGGKAYMYKLFRGPGIIRGVKNKKINCKALVGEIDSEERGTPGFVSNNRDFEISSFDDELISNLERFKVHQCDLPPIVRETIYSREAFTIVEGWDPVDWKDININYLIKKIVGHPQATLAIQQVDFYVFHNGKLVSGMNPLKLESIEPYPGLDEKIEYSIPDILVGSSGNQVSTTKNGKFPKGKLTLFTSKENMERSYKSLKPRWKLTYKTKNQMIGQKEISEIVPNTPGSLFIYAEIELETLNEYSQLGRHRPTEGPLIDAIDIFSAAKIKDLAKKINELRRQDLDESMLEEIQKDNKFLNDLKNQFLPSGGVLDVSSLEGDKGGKEKRQPTFDFGKVPEKIEASCYELKMARGFKINLSPLLKPVALDKDDKPVRKDIIWSTDDTGILKLDKNGDCEAISAGTCNILLSIKKPKIVSPPIAVEVIAIKDVILSPRTIELKVGGKKEITPQITTENDKKCTDILLNWRQSDEESDILRVSPRGIIYGNKAGNTSLSAGVDDSAGKPVWSNIPVDVKVVPSDEKGPSGTGYPILLLTDSDIDPITMSKRQGDPDKPALWQEMTDFQNNIWWLNLQSRDAFYAYSRREDDARLWRMFHAKILVDMMIQVHMNEDYSRKGDSEPPAFWSDHKSAYDRKYSELTQAMWDKLEEFVERGERKE